MREDPFKTRKTDRLIDLAIREDTDGGDITSELIFDPDHRSEADILAKEEGVLAGVRLIDLIYQRISESVRCEIVAGDGGRVTAGERIARVSGETRSILLGERTVLNFLQKLSGIATLTRSLVDRVAGRGIILLDTRKTTPGLRALEKYAVRAGGGMNHRFGLSEMVLVKENHIAAAGGISTALERVEAGQRRGRRVEVEVRGLDELKHVLRSAVDRVMLDNFSPEEVRAAIELIAHSGRDVAVEVSGGINGRNIESYCIAGVDFISIGGLTHSAKALDISMIIERK